MKIKYENISLLVLIILVIKSMLIYSNYFKLSSAIENLIEIVCYIYIIFLNIKFLSKNKKNFFIFCLLCVIIFCSGILSGQMVYFSSFLIVCLSNTIKDKRKIVKCVYYTTGIILLIHIIIFLKNNTYTLSFVRDIRYNIGFNHPNIFGSFAFWCYAAFVYLNKNNIKKCFLGLFIIIFLYLLTNTRTMLICSIILLIFMYLSRFKFLYNFFDVVSKNIVWFSFIVVVLLICLYNVFPNNEFILNLDKILSYRLLYSNLTIEKFGITLFGRNILMDEMPRIYFNKYWSIIVTIDITYVTFLYKCGSIYIIFISALSYSVAKKNDVSVKVLIIIWALFALFESNSMNFIICFPLLFKNSFLKEIKYDS